MLSEGLPLTQPLPFDNPWHRLPWVLPVALLIWILGFWGIGLYLEEPERRPPEPKPLDAQFLELPPPATIQIPPVRHTPQRPRPAPTPTEPVQPMPETTPKPEVQEHEVSPVAPPPAPITPSPSLPSTTPLPAVGQGARAIYQPIPKIPDDLREDALTAVAVARFRVAADGTATVELITPTRNPRLNQVILDTLRTWRFFPAMKDGSPVASIQDIRVSVEVK